ncbi:MAG: SDR family NAD(P)-dependent oxidoreductase [Gemmatimonadaceae bacterium]
MKPTALITGASKGIGRAIARRLASTHAIVATARSETLLEGLAREIRAGGGTCRVLALDLRRPSEIAEKLGALDVDVLVNNAGVMHKSPVMELTDDEWQEMVDVNYSALFHASRAVVPAMIKRGRGHVVNIASIAGRSAFVGGAGYASTKHAVMGFSESLMLELRDHGVRVSVVCPGSVATGMVAEGVDTSWMLTPEDVAEAVAGVVAMPPHALVYQVEVRAARPGKR